MKEPIHWDINIAFVIIVPKKVLGDLTHSKISLVDLFARSQICSVVLYFCVKVVDQIGGCLPKPCITLKIVLRKEMGGGGNGAPVYLPHQDMGLELNSLFA